MKWGGMANLGVPTFFFLKRTTKIHKNPTGWGGRGNLGFPTVTSTKKIEYFFIKYYII
jgi:hypothetical protein